MGATPDTLDLESANTGVPVFTSYLRNAEGDAFTPDAAIQVLADGGAGMTLVSDVVPAAVRVLSTVEMDEVYTVTSVITGPYPVKSSTKVLICIEVVGVLDDAGQVTKRFVLGPFYALLVRFIPELTNKLHLVLSHERMGTLGLKGGRHGSGGAYAVTVTPPDGSGGPDVKICTYKTELLGERRVVAAVTLCGSESKKVTDLTDDDALEDPLGGEDDVAEDAVEAGPSLGEQAMGATLEGEETAAPLETATITGHGGVGAAPFRPPKRPRVRGNRNLRPAF